MYLAPGFSMTDRNRLKYVFGTFCKGSVTRNATE
jgi:hypothetical protein